VSIVLWWHAWSTHPTSVTICGCGDPALFLWFLEWPAHAIAHGSSLFHSTALFHPGGINLLSNTSVLAIGIPLAPVTWLFGPVATLNVASTLGPALTALAMFWLLRRWVRWTPAAFAGGLLYGFSPYVVSNLALAHLMTGVLLVLPLIIACLDELLVRQRRRPVLVGGVLGLLIVVQFFVSTEVLVIVAIAGVAGLVLLVGYALVMAQRGLVERARHGLTGLVVAAGVSLAVLAYPIWFALAGPMHLSGQVWPGRGIAQGAALEDLWRPASLSRAAQHLVNLSGYQGSTYPADQYLGLGLVILLGVALVIWRRDRRLWFFGGLGVVAALLGLGTRGPSGLPWRIFADAPIVENVIPRRFMIVTTLCAAAMLAIVLDHVHAWVRSSVRAVAGRRVAPQGAGLAGTLAGFAAGLAVASAALVPVAQNVAASTPLTTQAVKTPAWFVDVAPHLPPGQVILTYPVPFSGLQSAESWQALDRMHFAMAGGGGPEGVPSRAGKERAGFVVLSAVSFSGHGFPPPTAEEVDAVRKALVGWGVTLIVVPDPAGRPGYDQGMDTPSALGLFTSAVGRPPRYADGAWVWGDVQALGPPVLISTEDFGRCTTDQVWRSGPQGVPACVMTATRSST